MPSALLIEQRVLFGFFSFPFNKKCSISILRTASSSTLTGHRAEEGRLSALRVPGRAEAQRNDPGERWASCRTAAGGSTQHGPEPAAVLQPLSLSHIGPQEGVGAACGTCSVLSAAETRKLSRGHMHVLLTLWLFTSGFHSIYFMFSFTGLLALYLQVCF